MLMSHMSFNRLILIYGDTTCETNYLEKLTYSIIFLFYYYITRNEEI